MRFSLVFLLLLISCEKVTYYEDRPIIGLRAGIAHRGGRTASIRENSLAGCINALKVCDGVEVDIQISKDGTLWLSHDRDVLFSDKTSNCFPETRDAEIKNIPGDDGSEFFYTRLEDVIAYMAKNAPEKYIIVDLKGWNPCSGNSLDIEGMMRLAGEQVALLGLKYQIASQIILETDAITVLNWATKIAPQMQTLLRVYGDLERGMLVALQAGITGISLKLNSGDSLSDDYIALLHKKGLRISVWNLAETETLEAWQAKGVDYVQYDMK